LREANADPEAIARSFHRRAVLDDLAIEWWGKAATILFAAHLP